MSNLDRFKVTLGYETAVKTKKLKDSFKTPKEQQIFKKKLLTTQKMLVWLKENNWTAEEIKYLISCL
jgi:hypothetical protein